MSRRDDSLRSFALSCGGLFLSASALAAGAMTTGGFFNSAPSGWWRNGSALDLDFANDRYDVNGTTYSGIANFITGISGTFSRGSSGTYYDNTGTLKTAASNIPRMDYDPTTLSLRGLLLEESSTNQLQYSSSFSTAPWSNTAPLTLTANAATAPDGTNTAFSVSNDGSGNGYLNQSGLPVVASTTVTRSIYVKAGTTSALYFQFNDSTNCGTYCVAQYNLSTKTASWSSAHAAQGTISLTQLPNGWFRAAATFTYSAAGVSDDVTYIAAYGTGVGSLYLWGAQLELKSYVTSYIATTSSTVTRSGDSLSVPSATWLNAAAGTLLVNQEYTLSAADYNPIIGVSEADSFGVNYQGQFGNNICNLINGSSVNAAGAPAASGMVKTAATYSATQNQLSKAGATASANATAKNMTNATTMLIGKDFNGVYSPPKHVARVTYFGNEQSAGALKDYSR